MAKLQITGSPGELERKGADLIKSLAERLEPYSPAAAEVLEVLSKSKAAGLLDDPILQSYAQKLADRQRSQTKAMLDEIMSVVQGNDASASAKNGPSTPE